MRKSQPNFWIDISCIQVNIALELMAEGIVNGESTLVQVKA